MPSLVAHHGKRAWRASVMVAGKTRKKWEMKKAPRDGSLGRPF